MLLSSQIFQDDTILRCAWKVVLNCRPKAALCALGGGLVDGASELGRSYVTLARTLTGTEPSVAPPRAPESDDKRHSVKDFFASNLRGLLGKTTPVA